MATSKKRCWFCERIRRLILSRFGRNNEAGKVDVDGLISALIIAAAFIVVILFLK